MFLSWLESLAASFPVTWFVFIGAFIEEIVAPIPSPLVMALAGSIAASQGNAILYLFYLAVIGAFSKTIGSAIIYFITSKAGDFFIDRFGKFFGISQKDTEGLGKFLNQGMRDDVGIFLLRAIPIMPTAPVSIISGAVKIKFRTYVISSFLGLIVRNMIYLYFGYISLGAIESLSEGFESLEKIGYLILSVFSGFALLWLYRQRQRSSGLKVVEDILDFAKGIFNRK